ncbi:hypothetical protein NKH77_22710 [Streptomyces sp. M19]
MKTAMRPGDAATVDQVKGGHPERVFPGLTRKLTAAGYDETYGPADAAPRWTTADGGVGAVDAKGCSPPSTAAPPRSPPETGTPRAVPG